MPRGYGTGTIRDSTSLTQAEWKRILNLMTAPCTIAQMTEAGIERHTAEIVRAKTLAAIVAVQTTVKLKKKAVLAFETVPEKQKRAKTVLSANNMEYQVVIAADANGNHIGTVLPAKSILKETMYVSDELDDWISDHGVDESTVLDPGNDIDLAWHKFVSPFRSISMKYLNDYLQWFCYLRQQEVIGKSKKDIVNMLWKMINEQERTLSNRNFRNR